jgi:CRP/FNR family cyclic AMP-dependent transcriptional regulator
MQLDPVRHCEIFRMLDDEQYAHIAARLKHSKAQPDDVLYSEGAPADTISIVASGELHAMKTSRVHQGKVVLCEFGPGDIIGEMALLADPERSATVKVNTPVELATFSRADFGALERQRPDIALTILKGVVRILAQRLQDTSADFADYQHS